MTEKIIIICGTNRPEALSLEVSMHYQHVLGELNAESEIINLAELPEDFVFSALYKKAGKNDEFNLFREKMKEADKMVFIVPEYNGSFPGILKAFIDGLKFPETFTNKKGAIVGISSGSQGASLAMSHLTDIFNYCGMHVLAYKPRLTNIEKYVVDGKLIHEDYQRRIIKQARALISF